MKAIYLLPPLGLRGQFLECNLPFDFFTFTFIPLIQHQVIYKIEKSEGIPRQAEVALGVPGSSRLSAIQGR